MSELVVHTDYRTARKCENYGAQDIFARVFFRVKLHPAASLSRMICNSHDSEAGHCACYDCDLDSDDPKLSSFSGSQLGMKWHV